MALVPPGGFEFIYNGYRFDPDYTHTTQMSVHPVLSKDGRTVIYSEFVIGVRTFIVGYPTDPEVTRAMKLLTKSGAPLQFNGRSIGDLNINTGGKTDVIFGPIPRPLNFVFNGAKGATQIDWVAVAHIPTCDDAVYQFAAMDLAFSVEHRPRQNGRVDRVVAGELRVANNRIDPAARQMLDSPDAWRDKVVAPVPSGFRREWASWKVDETKTRLSFGWTDIEFGGAIYPMGIAWCEASHRSDSADKGLVTYQSRIEAEYLVAAGYPPVTAERAFARLVNERWAAARKEGKGQSTIVPVAFSAAETGIYSDPRCTFALTYMVVGTTLRQLVKQSGMWVEPKDKWEDWKNSVQSSVLSPYGYSSIAFTPGDDRIVDLCKGEMESPGITAARNARQLRGLDVRYPNPESSWVSYHNAIRIEADSGLAVFRDEGAVPADNPIVGGELVADVRALPGAPPAGEIDADKAKEIAGLLFGITNPLVRFDPAMRQGDDFAGVAGVPSGRLEENRIGGEEAEQTRVQHRAAPLVYVYMTGYAMRVGFPIPCPELTDVEGEIPVKDNRLDRGEGFVCAIVANAAVPVYGARWNLRYSISKIPARPITPPANPLFGGR